MSPSGGEDLQSALGTSNLRGAKDKSLSEVDPGVSGCLLLFALLLTLMILSAVGINEEVRIIFRAGFF